MSAPITLTGRLGGDPDIKFGSNGNAVAKFSVVTSSRRNVDGNWVDVDRTWWTVVCFKQLAERVGDTLRKGQAVIVVGDVKQVEWEQDGQKRSRFEVTARTVGPDLRFDAPGINRETTAPVGDAWTLPSADAAPF